MGKSGHSFVSSVSWQPSDPWAGGTVGNPLLAAASACGTVHLLRLGVSALPSSSACTQEAQP
jgi:hypothetical protein